MGQTAGWIMPRRVYNPPKTIFNVRFAELPKVTDRKAIVRGINQLANASAIAPIVDKVNSFEVGSFDSIFSIRLGSAKIIA